MYEADCGRAAPARCGLRSTAASPRGRGSHSRPPSPGQNLWEGRPDPMCEADCGRVASARCGLRSTAASPRGRGSHSRPQALGKTCGRVARTRCTRPIVGGPPRPDVRGRLWEGRLGPMRPSINRRIAARARLPLPPPKPWAKLVGGSPRPDAAFDQAPLCREGAAPTPAPLQGRRNSWRLRLCSKPMFCSPVTVLA
jgi:hypothetical protein